MVDRSFPIKVRWTGRARERAMGDAQHKENVYQVLTRQKTNIVVKNREELRDTLYFLEDMWNRNHPSRSIRAGRSSASTRKAVKRVFKELKTKSPKDFQTDAELREFRL